MKTINKLTHAEYFRGCEEIRNHREIITTTMGKFSEVAKFISEKLGFVITLDKNISRKSTGVDQGAAKKRNTLILTRSIVDLMKQLGVEPSGELIDLLERCGGTYKKKPPQVNGIPVRNVVDPKLIPVVNS